MINNVFTPAKKKTVLWLAMLLMPISGMGIYLYLPTLSTLTEKFGTTQGSIQLTISAYLLGLGLPQILFGIVSDRIGRRKLLIPALLIFPVITLTLPFAPNVSVLLILRFFQGVAISVSDVSIKALMPDTFAKEELDKSTNYLIIAWAIGPILSPILGDFLQSQFGWRFPFYFLSAYGFVNFLLCLFLLPETNPNPRKLNLKEIRSMFFKILFNKTFITLVSCMIMLYMAVEIFNTMGPFVVRDTLHMKPGEFSRLASYLGIAWLIGNAANRFHAERKDLDAAIIYRVILIFLASVAMVTFAILEFRSYWVIAVPLFLIIYGCGLIFPRLFSTALGMFPQASGMVAAILGTILTIGVSLTTAMASRLLTTTQLPMSLFYLCLSIGLGIIYWLGIHKK